MMTITVTTGPSGHIRCHNPLQEVLGFVDGTQTPAYLGCGDYRPYSPQRRNMSGRTRHSATGADGSKR